MTHAHSLDLSVTPRRVYVAPGLIRPDRLRLPLGKEFLAIRELVFIGTCLVTTTPVGVFT